MSGFLCRKFLEYRWCGGAIPKFKVKKTVTVHAAVIAISGFNLTSLEIDVHSGCIRKTLIRNGKKEIDFLAICINS